MRSIYGNLAYGIEAAAETYFNTTAEKLTFSQSAFLAGLPQAPGVYDIFTNREATLKRLQQVLVLTYEDSKAQNCIAVSNSPQPMCVDSATALAAYDEIQKLSFRRAASDHALPALGDLRAQPARGPVRCPNHLQLGVHHLYHPRS